MPYALDLVRLGTSAVLGCPACRCAGRYLRQRSCAAMRAGLADPHAVHARPATTRGCASWSSCRTRSGSISGTRSRRTEGHEGSRRRRAMSRRSSRTRCPSRGSAIAILRRATAGAGSLGRPRFVGVAQWRGAPVVREAKARVAVGLDASRRARGAAAALRRDRDRRVSRARSLVRACGDDVVVRRLSPNNRKLDAETDMRRRSSTSRPRQGDAARDGARSRVDPSRAGRCRQGDREAICGSSKRRGLARRRGDSACARGLQRASSKCGWRKRCRASKTA